MEETVEQKNMESKGDKLEFICTHLEFKKNGLCVKIGNICACLIV